MIQNEEEKMKSRDPNWSEICSDALELILESLSLPDFHRARTVCSTWYSVSKSCVAGSRNRYPWLILFPEKFSVSKSCKLFDSVENKRYDTRDLGDELSESRCIASYGNWVLMLNPNLDFSIVNVFSGERINLPELSCSVRFRRKDDGGIFPVRFRRKDDGGIFLEHSWFDRETIINRYIKSAVLWIDEKTKDYVVSWIYNDLYLFSYKRGDDSWWHLEDTKCLSMAYKDHKLCVFTCDHFIKIFDFSGGFPSELIEENPYLNLPFYYTPEPWEFIWKRRLVITNSGDVVIVLSLKGFPGEVEKRLFYIFRMNPEGTEWERVDSLCDEMLVFNDGVTLAAPGEKIDGRGIVKSNSIYFVADDIWPPQTNSFFQSCTGAFDLATTKLSWSGFPCFSNIRWFVPGSDKK